MVFAAAQSQLELLAALRSADDIDWRRVTTFQMDEYAKPLANGGSLASFLDRELFDAVRPGTVHRIRTGDDSEAECDRYEALLRAEPIDLVCLGIGESGHLAYNDPPAARFGDERFVRLVAIGERSRQQAVNDGQFPDLAAVPGMAYTITVPGLLAATRVVGVVPGTLRHEALRRALDGPIDESCPASALRTHADCTLYVDNAAYEGQAANGA